MFAHHPKGRLCDVVVCRAGGDETGCATLHVDKAKRAAEGVAARFAGSGIAWPQTAIPGSRGGWAA